MDLVPLKTDMSEHVAEDSPGLCSFNLEGSVEVLWRTSRGVRERDEMGSHSGRTTTR